MVLLAFSRLQEYYRAKMVGGRSFAAGPRVNSVGRAVVTDNFFSASSRRLLSSRSVCRSCVVVAW